MKRRANDPLRLLAFVLATACGDEGGGFGFDDAGTVGGSGIAPGDDSGSGSTATGGDDGTTEPSADDDDDGTSGSTGGDSGGSGSETGLPPSVPCTGIDMVFVLDNSDTMAEEQMRLQLAAPAWIDQIVAQTPTIVEGVRVGVITTDNSTFAQADGTGLACGPFASGSPWMVPGETFVTELGCALAQGTAGDPNERPVDMLRDALSDEALAPEGVHDGFLRDDALLVIVVLTTEEDDLEPETEWGSAGDPPEWIDALAGLKQGYANNVVVLALVGHEKPNACPDFQWDGVEGAEIATRLIELTDAFPQGAVGDICEAEYSTFLTSIVPGVVAACDGYIP